MFVGLCKTLFGISSSTQFAPNLNPEKAFPLTHADDRKKLLERIRKLRALAENAGATEAEALRAAEILTRLIAEHAISETELSIREESRRCGEMIFTALYVNDIYRLIVPAIWRVFSIKSYSKHSLDRDPDLGMEFKIIQTFIFGHETDREAAWTLLTICNGALRNETALYSKSLGRMKGKAQALLDFETGMAERLAQRIEALRPTGTGLIVLKSQLVNDEFARHLREQGVRLGGGGFSVGNAATAAGQAGASAANRVDLGQGVRVPTPGGSRSMLGH